MSTSDRYSTPARECPNGEEVFLSQFGDAEIIEYLTRLGYEVRGQRHDDRYNYGAVLICAPDEMGRIERLLISGQRAAAREFSCSLVSNVLGREL